MDSETIDRSRSAGFSPDSGDQRAAPSSTSGSLLPAVVFSSPAAPATAAPPTPAPPATPWAGSSPGRLVASADEELTAADPSREDANASARRGREADSASWTAMDQPPSVREAMVVSWPAVGSGECSSTATMFASPATSAATDSTSAGTLGTVSAATENATVPPGRFTRVPGRSTTPPDDGRAFVQCRCRFQCTPGTSAIGPGPTRRFKSISAP